MEQLHFSHYAAIILTVLCVFFIILIFLAKKKINDLTVQLIKTTVTLEITQKQVATLEEKNVELKEFQDNLKVAELTTKLQKPRLAVRNTETSYSAPGKYSNIQALTQKGLSVEEIASALAVSSHEAQQLINLSKLADGNSDDKSTS